MAGRAPVACDRCGAGPAGADLFAHCALCGLRLCDDCLAGGCCGQVPAVPAGVPPARARRVHHTSQPGRTKRRAGPRRHPTG